MKNRWRVFRVEEFERFAGAWDALAHASVRTPLLSRHFIDPLLKHFGTRQERLAVFGNNAQPQAMALLTRAGIGAWQTFQPSQAPIGLWVQDPSCRFDALARALLRDLPGVSLAIGVTQQDPDLIAPPATNGRIQVLDYIQTARVPVLESFERYWAARGKNLRHNMKRQRSKLAESGITARLEALTAPDQVPEALDDFARLESAGWKAEGGTAVRPDNAQGKFYRALMENFCHAGAGRIYRYWYGDRVVAVELCIEDEHTLIVLKTAYDETIQSSSPAFLMKQEYFKHIFDEGRIKRIEFYGRLMDWHTKWTDQVRTLYHVNYYRWAALPRIRRLLSRTISPQPSAARPAALEAASD
jgi:hypothetical protein